MKYTEDELQRFRQNSIFNKSKLLKSKKAGCFWCLKVFEASEVYGWLDGKPDYTAACPHCTIDSVMPESDEYVLDEEFLTAIRGAVFAGASPGQENSTHRANSFADLFDQHIRLRSLKSSNPR